MKRLQLEYQIKNISVLYEEGSVIWDNAEFTFKKELTGNLKIWENNIEPEQIAKTWKNLEERGESFQIAMKYLGNHSITFKTNDYVTYYFDDQKFTPRNEAEIRHLIKYLRGEIASFNVGSMTVPVPKFSGSSHQSPIPLPTIMPLIPHELHGKAATLIVANQLANYPDLQLKLGYLFLEEFLAKDALENDKMKYARDFVSHPICYNPKVVGFIISELQSAKLGDNVRFERDKGDHIAFVSKYANLVLQKAEELFGDKVKSLGGCVRC
jgi:hypothetical protein